MDPTKKELYTAKRSAGVDVSDEHIHSIWESVRNGELNWMLLVVDGNKAKLHASGATEVSDLIEHLSDDDMYFGFFRTQVASYQKIYGLSFLGNNVAGLKRGKASLYKAGILNAFENHGEVTITGGIEDATVNNIKDQISKLARVSASDIAI